MIHIDRNHHSPLSNSPHSKQNLILPNQHSLQIPSTWSDLPQRPPNSQSDSSKQSQDPRRDPATPPEGDPVVSRPSGPGSPASPADGNSTSPTTEERSSSLSPVPENTAQPEQNTDTADTKPSEDRILSRVSTPLSELSPPPDDMDTPAADTTEPSEKKESGENRGDDENGPKSHPEANGVNSPKPANSSQQLSSSTASGPNADGGTEAHLHHPPSMNHSPMPDGTSSVPTHSSEQKVAMMLELNSELLKVSMEFQTRGIQLTDSRFQQYASRIKSNLDYMARWADNPIHPTALPPLPIVDAPPPVEFTSTERIQRLYSELSTVFAKALAQRNQLLSATPQSMTPTPTLKRERSEDFPLDMMNKRRDTGENKMLNSPSMMPPPPSLPQLQQQENQYPSASTTPMPNGMMPMSAQSQPTQMPEQMGAGGATAMNQPGMMNEAQIAAQRQAAMRLQQQQRQNSQQGMSSNRQMSPPSSGSGNMNQQMPGGGSNTGMQNQINGAGPSHPQMAGGGGGVAVGLTPQQAFQILNNPNHPFLAAVMKQIPGFGSLSMQEQLQKISQLAAIKMQEQQQQQQRNAMNLGRPAGGMPNMSSSMNNMGMGVNPSSGGLSSGMGIGGNQFPNVQSGQASPVAHQAQMAQNPMMMGQGGSGSPSGMDSQRSMTGTPQLGGMPSSNMNMNPMNQRQLMMIQQQHQQNRGAGNMGGGNMSPANMMMNPQQMAFMQQQQERMRQQQQQQQQQIQPPASSPTHSHGGVGSPMMTGNAGGDNNSFPPVLRSGSAIPGIARSARSPSDGGVQSPMTPRMPNRSSMGQEDFARMMMQQQQQAAQQQRGMQPQSPFNPQQMQASPNWQQQQMGLGPSSAYGMNNRPGSASGFVGGGAYGAGVGGGGQGSNSGVVGGGSPPGLSQTWGTPNNNPSASYPFATSSPGHQSDLAPTRHMSATPAPGQQPMQAQNMISPTSADPFLFANDFSFPNWTQ